MVFLVIFDSSLIIENVLDIQRFFLVLAFYINDIDHDFSAASFDAAHDHHNNLNFCVYYHFNCVLGKFTDIVFLLVLIYITKCTKIIKLITDETHAKHELHFKQSISR